MSNYSEKLKHPKWQMRRLEIMKRDKATCQRCGDTETQLHIHHKDYVYGKAPWEYADSDLETLCSVCHAKEHDLIPDIQYERKYEHLLISKETPDVIISINNQLYSLTRKLTEDINDALMEDVLKNIMFLTNKLKELKEK